MPAPLVLASVTIGGYELGRGGKQADHRPPFGLNIDGFELGRFEVLIAKIASGAWVRVIRARELPFVFQHAGEFRPAKTTPTAVRAISRPAR